MAKREITARQAKQNLKPFGYTGPARWNPIDVFVEATPRAKMALTANAGLFVKSGYNPGGVVKSSYINDSGTLVQEMDDGSIKKFGAEGNTVDIDSAGQVTSNVSGGHTLGSDLTKKETVDLSEDQTQYLSNTFGNPKMSGENWIDPTNKSKGSWGNDNVSARDYGGRDGILRNRGSRVVDLVNQGANVYVADDGSVMLQTPDGSEAKLNYGAAMTAFNNNLISGGKATWSAGGDEEEVVEDTTDDDTEEDVVQSTQPVAPKGVPASIAIEPSAKDVQDALEVFTSTGVNLPTGVNRMKDTVSDTPVLGGMTGTTEVELPTFESKTQQQSKDFEQRAKDQAQLIKPQTLAEKTAAGNIGKLEQRLYRNSVGMNTYVLGVYNQNGEWTPSQGIPQGYAQVKQNDDGGLQEGEEEDEATVNVDGEELTQEEMAQEQADLTAGAIANPAGTASASSVNQMTGDEEGTVMSGTTGQTPGVAPIVDDPAQVEKVTTVDTPEEKEVEKAGLTTSKDDMKNELDGVNPQTGTVGTKIEAQTSDTTKVGDLEAEQGTATVVENAPTRTLKDGELIDGSTVDQSKVSDIYGDKKLEAVTVSGELNRIIGSIESGKTPPWAAGQMRNAMSILNARGLSASSLAGQAVIQSLMESALPIAQMDANNKQAVAVESARQRATFLNQEFTQEFETKVRNSAKISEIANLNFSAEQQIALENAKMAQTMNLANLGNKQAIVMAEAAQIANLEMASLNNRQQAQVQNAQNFLAMDMANLNNAQATEIFKAQTMANTILSDTAATNANAQFNASSENQVNQFYATMQSQLGQFNSAQTNAMKQFNAGETNAIQKFNSEIQSAREVFNAQMYAQIAQANAKWRQDVTTTNNANLNQSNFQYAKDVNGLTNKSIDEIWQRERDIMSFAYNSSEGAKGRVLSLMLADKKLDSVRMQLDAANDDAFTENIMSLVFGGGGIGSLFGGKGLLGSLGLFQ